MLTMIATVAAFEKSNLGSLRSIQHKDQYGNIISMFRPLWSILIHFGGMC